MELNFEEVLFEKKKEAPAAKASTVLDSSSTYMKLRPKSGEYIEINYEELASFLKKSLNRTFTKNSAKKFAEDLRDFLGLYTDSEMKKKESEGEE